MFSKTVLTLNSFKDFSNVYRPPPVQFLLIGKKCNFCVVNITCFLLQILHMFITIIYNQIHSNDTFIKFMQLIDYLYLKGN